MVLWLTTLAARVQDTIFRNYFMEYLVFVGGKLRDVSFVLFVGLSIRRVKVVGL